MPVNGIAELTAQVKAVSGIYAARFGIDRDADWYLLKLAEEVGELVGAALAAGGRSRPSMPADQLDAAVQTNWPTSWRTHCCWPTTWRSTSTKRSRENDWRTYRQNRSINPACLRIALAVWRDLIRPQQSSEYR